jgi:Glycosyl transferase family 2
MLVDRFGAYLAEAFGCSQVISVSSSNGEHAHIVGEHDAAALARSIVIGRVELHSLTGALLSALHRALDGAPAGLLVVRPGGRIASPLELRRLLSEHQFAVPFTGWADDGERSLIAILENNESPPLRPERAGFRVVAVMPTFNEADIVRQSLRYLVAQGIEVYVLDNWSTDGTAEQAERFLGGGVIAVERFPASGPVATYEWRRILGRVETLATTIDADWFMLHDADERRYAPWPGVSLKRGLHHVDRCGFTCVDHVVVHHWPQRQRFDPSLSLESQLPSYTFSDHPGHYHQRRAWKNLGCDVSIAPSAGHDARFPGRLVYPFKFLLRHYPIRSQEHGEQKVFAERVGRWNAEERSLGWHRQYEGTQPGQSFLRDAATLENADEAAFHEKYLIQRLSGVGVFGEPPVWTTGPRERFDGAPVGG